MTFSGEGADLITSDKLIESDGTDHYAEHVGNGGWCVTWLEGRVLSRDEAIAAMELAEIVSRGRDGGPDTTNYAYFTWIRIKELAEVLGVIPLKTVLYLESLEPDAEGSERSDPK